MAKNKLTRSQKRKAKPCYRHKGNGETDGKKTSKSNSWWQGAPYTEVKPGVFVGTRYSSR